MDRRAYLGALAAGLGGLAGCSATASDTDRTETGISTDDSPTPDLPTLADVDLPVPRTELTYAAPKDVFPAIVDPVFGQDWSGIELDGYGGEAARPRLTPADRVVGVVRNGEARAYPLRLFDDHEVVNDTFHGPLLVTFCPLCGSGVTAERLVDGEPARFGVSGRLWNSDLVLYDEPTESYWSQILATAIRGPRTGDQLSLVPSTLTTWEQWQETHPETVVLRPPPESGTIDGSGPRFYGGEPNEAYRESSTIGVGKNDFSDDRLAPKTEVLGISHDGTSKAYPLPAVQSAGVINDTVGDLPVVVTHAQGTLVAYDRRVDGRTLSFQRVGENTLRGGGSRWDILSGEALDDTHEGTTLEQANDLSQMFWFAWAQHHPETDLYQ